LAEARHALARSLSKLTIGVARDFDRRRERNLELGLQESFQQFQIPIAGLAYQGITWAKKWINFDFVFFEAPLQRDSNFVRPQFTYGFVTEPVDDKAAPLPIIVSAMFEFVEDDEGATSGGWLHVGVHSPTPETRQFQGQLHLTFQGFGTARDTGVGE
jgi:hypothetical protein